MREMNKRLGVYMLTSIFLELKVEVCHIQQPWIYAFEALLS